jgi:S1-C subfamily serine protease
MKKACGILALFSVIALVTPAAAKDYLTINSDPPGATVELNGVVVGKTPYQVQIPGGYLRGTKSVWGKRLGQQVHVRVTLDGYLPKEMDLANGPFQWIALNGTYHGDYWILKSATFNLPLNKAATTFAGTVTTTSTLLSAPSTPALSVEQVVHLASPSVLWLKGSEGRGSGFFVTDTGIAVTNAHVARNQSEMTASAANGQSFQGKVIYIDPAVDLALVQVVGTNFPHLVIAEPGTIHVGSTVLAIGTPSQGMQNTVTRGIVSGIGSMANEPGTWVQTDAAINPGNSGGPLLDTAGEVVGVTTQKEFVSKDGRPLQGIGFALSSADVIQVLKKFYPNLQARTPFAPALQASGTGKVVISADVDGADILVDGKFVGSAPSSLVLTAGPHKIEVRAPNRVAWQRDLEVLKDSDVTLRATLPPLH